MEHHYNLKTGSQSTIISMRQRAAGVERLARISSHSRTVEGKFEHETVVLERWQHIVYRERAR
jgi:hypothetical protein